jgi:hypothetical protein
METTYVCHREPRVTVCTVGNHCIDVIERSATCQDRDCLSQTERRPLDGWTDIKHV